MRNFVYELVFVLAALMFGCSPTTYVRNGEYSGLAPYDLKECEYEVDKSLGNTVVGDYFIISYQRAGMVRRCMELRGYSQK